MELLLKDERKNYLISHRRKYFQVNDDVFSDKRINLLTKFKIELYWYY